MKQKLKPIIPADESKYPGEWIAFDSETLKIIAHDRKLKIAAAEAEQKGYPNPVFHAVPDGRFHGHFHIIRE